MFLSDPQCLTYGITRSHRCVPPPFIFTGPSARTCGLPSPERLRCGCCVRRRLIASSSSFPSLPPDSLSLFPRSFVVSRCEVTRSRNTCHPAAADGWSSVKFHRLRPTDDANTATSSPAAITEKWERIRCYSNVFRLQMQSNALSQRFRIRPMKMVLRPIRHKISETFFLANLYDTTRYDAM